MERGIRISSLRPWVYTGAWDEDEDFRAPYNNHSIMVPKTLL